MAYYLHHVSASDTSGKYVDFPEITIATDQDFEFEFEAFSTSATFFRPFGRVADLNSRCLFLTDNTTIRLTNNAGTNLNWTVPAYTRTDFNVFKFARVSNLVTLYINGVARGTPITNNGAFVFSRFFANGASAGITGAMKYFKISAGGSLVRNYVNSTGTGSTWFDIVSGQDGALTGPWPSDDSEWVFYEGPVEEAPKNIWRRFPTGRIASTNFIPWNNAEQIVDDFFEALPNDGAVISVTMPQMTVTVAASKTVPIVSASIAFSMPQMSVSVAASKTVPTFSASVAFTMPQMQVAASASKTVPTFTATIAATMPQMSVAAVAGVTAPVFASTVNVTMPQMSVAATGSVLEPGVAASISVTMPQMQVAVTASKTVPAFGALIAFAMPQMSIATSASSAVPNYPAAISVSMPQMVVAATAENYVEGISAAVTFTMPQMRVTAYSDGVIFYAAETAHIEQRIRSRSITQLARSAALYASARSSHINQIAKSRHIAYNYQSTHIEQRSAQNAIT